MCNYISYIDLRVNCYVIDLKELKHSNLQLVETNINVVFPLLHHLKMLLILECCALRRVSCLYKEANCLSERKMSIIQMSNIIFAFFNEGYSLNNTFTVTKDRAVRTST